MSIVKYLLPGKADVHVRDADGWTALHNACSKVALPIMLLVVLLTSDRDIWISSSGSATMAEPLLF